MDTTYSYVQGLNADATMVSEDSCENNTVNNDAVIAPKVLNEFDKDAIVARYGKDGMTYFTGEFTQSGEGIFVPYPKRE